jgi:UDP-N-acetylmuramoylalanine--D-glutamate ligase
MQLESTTTNWLILGSGVSGQSAFAFLRKKNHHVALFEQKEQTNHFSKDKKIISKLNDLEEFLKNKKPKVVLSPGFSSTHPAVLKCKQHQLQMVSEVQLGLCEFQGKTIAITGTNGKTTIALMCQHILKKTKTPCASAGNIGTPITSLNYKGLQIIVLELSSFQLEQSTDLKLDISIFNNFSKDHTSYHQNLSSYFKAKEKILSFSKTPTITSEQVLNAANSIDHPIKKNYILYNKELLNNKHLKTLYGKHNQENAAVALTACAQALPQFSPQRLAPLLTDFKLPEHRLEKLESFHTPTIINDSKSTNLHSTISAINTSDSPILLLLGGVGKDEDFVQLEKFQHKIYKIIAFGHSALQVKQALEKKIKVETYSSLNNFFKEESFSSKDLQKCKTILFSPGCASFDEFLNYQARGTFFKEQIKIYFNQE